MKRKIIQLSTNTSVISLPAGWIRTCNLKKGDEVDIEVSGNGIVVSSSRPRGRRETEIMLDSDDTLIAWEAIDSAYISGYDQISVRFSKPRMIEHIQKITSRMIGMAVTEEKKDACVIRDIGGQDHEEFDVVLRRVFLLLKTMGDDGIAAAKTGDFETLAAMRFRDYSVNSYTSYCLRCINRGQYPPTTDPQKTYLLLKLLESLGDKYRDMLSGLGKEKIRLGKKTLAYFFDLNAQYALLMEMFYAYNWKHAQQMVALRQGMKEKAATLIKSITGKEALALHQLWEIQSLLFDAFETVLTMRM